MKKTIAGVIIALAAVGAVVTFLVMNADKWNGDCKYSNYEVSNGNLVVSGGSFGITVPLSQISDAKMTDTMPHITTMTNGAWIRGFCKGEFILENNVKANLYVNIISPPFITFVHGDTVFYINAATPADTQSLYDLIK